MGNCLECQRASRCHAEMQNDLQVLGCMKYALEHNHIEQAKEELEIYIRRMNKRLNERAGRL